jgi:hypothetical protein
MAQVWFQQAGAGGWSIVPLDGDAFSVCPHRIVPIGPISGPITAEPNVLLIQRQRDGQEQWVILARHSARVQVSGQPVVMGIRTLENRDHVLVVDENSSETSCRFFLSTERQAQIVVHDGAAVSCARCGDPISAGQSAVQCPVCLLLYHETAESPCWCYGPHCVGCKSPTAAVDQCGWNPQEEDLL